ncbi:hypothetical protein [Deinococcus pimensis]|uniref:hypothetical protein n=1 Tax=Deinococcus pimensis TaxID=309888 RepID=UPI000488F2EA|nr:hypothetical protein [Deinococcus pimensis]
MADVAPNFARTFGVSALYLTTPFVLPDEEQEVVVGKARGQLLLGAFLKDDEVAFALRYGCDALEDRMEEVEVQVDDLRRRSCLARPQD